MDVSDSDEEKDKNAELFSAIREGRLQQTVQLLESGVKVNIIDRNNKDNTPLHYAIEKGNKEIVAELLSQKWTTDMNAKNNKLETPLHIAIREGNKELVQLLLSKPIKIDIKNNKGEIPLDTVKRLKPEWTDIIQILETPLASASGDPVSIPTTQQEQSQHENKNTNADSKNPIHGTLYQLKLLMLFLYRGVSHKYSFRLGTEIEEAKKFDDLVFEYIKGGRKEYRLLQAKHRKNETKKITKTNLLTESNGDFNLTKYFFSYLDSKREEFFKGGSIKDVTICTNVDFDFESLETNQIKVEKIEDKDDILDVKSDNKQPTRYRFKEDVTSLLKPKLHHYNLNRLARRLAECVLHSSSMKDDDGNDDFKGYYLALAEEVVDIKNKKIHDKFVKNKDISEEATTFRKAFINEINNNNISEEARKFRQAFINNIKHKSQQKLTLENVNEIVSERKVFDNDPFFLNLSKNIKMGENKNWPSNAISDDGIKDFLINHFVIAVNQPNEEELGKIIRDEIGEEFDLDIITTENIYNKFFMTMLNWLQGKERGRFFTYEEGKEFFKTARRGIPIWFRAKKPVQWFTGRRQELNDLHEKVRRSTEKITVISQMTSISGLGGIGKTELARQYIHEHSKNDYDNNVVWINAESEATLRESFRTLAQDKLRISTKNIDGKEKEDESIVEEVYRFFSKRRSLFIFDNTDKSDDLKTFLPFRASSSDNMHILITSRDRVWMEGIEVLNLNELNLEDAIEFVKNALSIPKDDPSKDQEIEELVKMLQCFPLALEQAVAHIREQKKDNELRGKEEYTIGSYLEEYEKKKKELLDSKAFQSLENDYAKTTFTTWKVTTNKIEANTEYGQLALEILDVIAYFASNIIPLEMFAKLEEDNDKLWKAVKLLNQYSMIKLEEGKLDVHRLVKEVTRLDLGDRNENVLEKALKLIKDGSSQEYPFFDNLCLSKGYPFDYKNDARSVWSYGELDVQDGSSQIDLFSDNLHLSNVDHAISVWSYASKNQELVIEFSSLPVLIVSELRATLRYQEAYLFGTHELKLLKRILGEDHPSVLSMMKNFAWVLFLQLKDDDALKMYRKLVEKKQIINELMKPKMCFFESHIGLILDRQGKYDEALKIFSYLYGMVKIKIIPSDGSIEHNLAVALFHNKKIDDAIKMNKNALKRKIDIFGSDHESTFNTEDLTVTLLEEQGKFDEAFEKCKQAYEKRKRILGLNQLDTLISYSKIGDFLFQQKKYTEALKIANEVDKEMEKLLPNHPHTIQGKNNIVRTLIALCKYDEALEKCKDVYEKTKKVLGPNHPHTLDSYSNFARLLFQQMKYDEALRIANEDEEEREKVFPNHPDTLLAKLFIVHILDAQCKYDEALEKCKEVYDNKKDNLITLRSLGTWYILALKFAKQRKYDKALKELKKVLEERKKILKPNHPDILLTVGVIGEVIRARDGSDDIHFRIPDLKLFYAAENGHLEAVIKLLTKDNANDKIFDIHYTLLHIAAVNGHVRVVEKLLEKEANVNAKDSFGSTALHLVVHENHLEVVNALLKGGADVNCYCDQFSLLRPLHIAAQDGHTKIVELLLKNSADIEATNVEGLTPLHIAAYFKHLDVVKILLERGANIDARNERNLKPSDITNDEAIKKVLLSTKELLNAIRRKHNESRIQQLLEDGAVINYFSGPSRLTSLHYAVSNGNLDIVRLLLSKKPNVNIADEDGWTPLHYAAQDGHLDIVELLLNHGADPSIPNRDKKIPLQLAEERFDQNPQIYQKICSTLDEIAL